jgi:KTSC domain
MTNTVDGNRQLEGSLHYDPAAYWCPRCWQFTTGCQHLVPPLKTKLILVEDWLIHALRYDRKRGILEVHLRAGGAYQHCGVSLEVALMLVRSPKPASIYNASIHGKVPFERVRVTDDVKNGGVGLLGPLI